VFISLLVVEVYWFEHGGGTSQNTNFDKEMRKTCYITYSCIIEMTKLVLYYILQGVGHRLT